MNLNLTQTLKALILIIACAAVAAAQKSPYAEIFDYYAAEKEFQRRGDRRQRRQNRISQRRGLRQSPERNDADCQIEISDLFGHENLYRRFDYAALRAGQN